MWILYIPLLAVIILFPFGQLTKIPILGESEISLYAQDIAVSFLSIGVIILIIKKVILLKHIPLILPIILFIGACTFSLIVNLNSFSAQELFISSLYLLRFTAYVSIYIAGLTLIRLKCVSDKRIIAALTASGIATAMLGLIQYALYPNLRNLAYLAWDPHEYRVFGTFFDSGFIGIILVLTLIQLAYFYFSKRAIARSLKTIVVVSAIITYSALALTYSRSSFVAFVASFSLLSYLRKSALLSILVIFLMGITIIFLPKPSETSEGVMIQRTSTVNARLVNYKNTINIVQGAPFFGVGFNTLRYVRRDLGLVPFYEWQKHHAAAGADSSFLFVFATTGIIGLFAYMYLWVKIVAIGIRQYNSDKMKRWGVLSLVSVTAILIHSIFLNSLFYPWVMVWMWLLLGVSHASLYTRRVSS